MTEQDVNAQHLAAMGLADQPLGQAYEQATQEEQHTRCDRFHPEAGSRCARQAGHEGRHARAGISWDPQPEPLTEAFTVNCDATKGRPGMEAIPHPPHTYTTPNGLEFTCLGHGDIYGQRDDEPGAGWVWHCGSCGKPNTTDHDPTGANGQCALCDRVTYISASQGPTKQPEPVQAFIYESWDQVPWVKHCFDCLALKTGPENIPALINHMAEHGTTKPTKQREGDQPLPTGGQQCVQDLIIAEMQESKRVGQERYGSVLKTFNGRSTIQDIAEEARDLHVYLTQVRAEAEADRATLVDVVRVALLKARDEVPAAQQAIRRQAVHKAAEVAVDAIMGWVAGQRAGAR